MQLDDELDLLALRYVSGELDLAQTEAFEVRLADDQVARDAVEFAVQVAQASATTAEALSGKALSGETLPAATQHRVRRPIGLLAAAAALLVCAPIVYHFATRSADVDAPDGPLAGVEGASAGATLEEAEARVLIASWVAFGEIEDEAAGAPADEGETLEEFTEVAGVFDTVDTPDWMMQGLVK